MQGIADTEEGGRESLCKIKDSSCHGDASVGRPQMPQAETERGRGGACYH